ncbi:hypothetical protein U1Q18_051758 [Sarracenia purpurea var. burkii]
MVVVVLDDASEPAADAGRLAMGFLSAARLVDVVVFGFGARLVLVAIFTAGLLDAGAALVGDPIFFAVPVADSGFLVVDVALVVLDTSPLVIGLAAADLGDVNEPTAGLAGFEGDASGLEAGRGAGFGAEDRVLGLDAVRLVLGVVGLAPVLDRRDEAVEGFVGVVVLAPMVDVVGFLACVAAVLVLGAVSGRSGRFGGRSFRGRGFGRRRFARVWSSDYIRFLRRFHFFDRCGRCYRGNRCSGGRGDTDGCGSGYVAIVGFLVFLLGSRSGQLSTASAILTVPDRRIRPP